MPTTVVITVVPTARYMEFPKADRKLPCNTLWKFFRVIGPPPPMVRLPWVLNAVTTSHTNGTRKMRPTTDMAIEGASTPARSFRDATGPYRISASEPWRRRRRM